MIKLKKKDQLALLAVGMCLCLIIIIYCAFALFFTSHFYYGTFINGIKVGGKTVAGAKELLLNSADTYTLTICEKDKSEFIIKSSDIDFTYDLQDKVEKSLENQVPLKWLFAKDNKQVTLTFDVSYNDTKLQDMMQKCIKNQTRIAPTLPHIAYTLTAYEVMGGEVGNEIEEAKLGEALEVAVKGQMSKLDLEESECYKRIEDLEGYKQLVKENEQLNEMVKAKITYLFGEQQEVVDGELIHDWLLIGDEISVDEEKVVAYVQELGATYNTVGQRRNFLTSKGKAVQVVGGDYGFKIDCEEETKALIMHIQKGETVEKEPLYAQCGMQKGKDDIGNTYVEVSLDEQYIWFYKEGKLVTEGSIVTGNVSKDYTTPPGTYKLDFKRKDAILRGPGYATPVSFWMPFNGDIGLHDAVWRGRFGGDIYLTNGSHGCVNLPYTIAEKIYEGIEKGMPVICYNMSEA